ncbi:MAG: hypothetical protein HUU29_02775 [Planctomycetaceae bacterium]|nr:hypothetical protein [Planctomycetaceae bacterium]
MRIAILLTSILFVACSSSSGPKNDPRDTSYWDDLTKNAKPPERDPKERWPEETFEALMQRAKEQRKAGDLITAAITVRQATMKSPWSLEAHELYQDIQFGRQQLATIHDEYLRHLGAHIERGTALYLFLRPTLLSMRVTEEVMLKDGKGPEAHKHYLDASNAAEVARQQGKPAFDAARPALERCFALAPLHASAHRLYQDLALYGAGSRSPDPAQLDVMCSRYEKLQTEYETKGDAVYFFERVASLKAPVDQSLVDSSLRLAKAIAQGLPGYWLFYGMGVVSVERALLTGDATDRAALLKLAVLSYNICTATNELVPEGYFGRGVAYDELGDRVKAIADLEVAVALSANAPEAQLLWRLGAVYIADGKLEKAIVPLQRGMELYPTLFDFPSLLGRVEAERGNNAAAVAAFEKAYTMLDPASDVAKNLRARIDALKSAK